MDDKKVKYDALDAMWAFVRMGSYQLHQAGYFLSEGQLRSSFGTC